MKTIHTIEYTEAKRIVDLIVAKALQLGKSAVVAVADSQGELIMLARMDGAPVASVGIATNKAWTAARERKATREIGEKVRDPERGHDIAYYGDPKYVGWGGGLPIFINREVVGAVAVSGLSSNEDAELATLGVELITAAEPGLRTDLKQ
ncbi:MAG TPA: heme-binding protein [Terriglobales bacterium]|nr:heme-binding protein [Terriglobales bacterium]